MSISVETPLGPFHVYPEGTITRALQAGQWWDAHLKPILDEGAGGWAIDIGAHVGWFTIYLAGICSKVIAVEPWPASFDLLMRNVRSRPGFEHAIQCWPVAASDYTTVLTYVEENDPTDPGSFAFTTHDYATTEVPAIALDPYISDTAPITIIKCDAQGADLRALQGLTHTIRRCRPIIAFEWEEGMAAWQGDTWDDYLVFFEGLNYTVERITPHYWDFVARPR